MPLSELKALLGRPLPALKMEPPKDKPVVRKTTSSGPSTRPKQGSLTGQVWDIADSLLALDPGVNYEGRDFRTEVIEKCVKVGINDATAGVQYAKWKKWKGSC